MAGVAVAATVHGDTTAFWWATGIFAVGLMVALIVFPQHPQIDRSPAAAGVALVAD
jgi:hypothetical protein